MGKVLRKKNNLGGIMGFLFSSKPSIHRKIEFKSHAMRRNAGYKRMRLR